MRALVLAIGALVIVAGCGRIPGAQVPTGDYKLYEANSSSLSQNVSVIDSRSHRVDLSLPLGTPSPDWTHLYTVGSGALVDLDPQTGATLHRMQLSGRFELPPATVTGVPGGLSQNGRWLVLESFDATSSGVRTATHLLVVDTTYAKGAQQINLDGFFEFDAVSNDGRRIFLIEYLDGNQYHVRFYDLGAGRLDPNIVFDKSDGSSAMAGVRLTGIPSHDGQWLYSVYAREHGGAFTSARKLHGESTEVTIAGHRIRLLKPMTYMNLSGQSVSATINYYKIPAEHVLVAFDPVVKQLVLNALDPASARPVRCVLGLL